jgi:hypothetical protein
MAALGITSKLLASKEMVCVKRFFQNGRMQELDILENSYERNEFTFNISDIRRLVHSIVIEDDPEYSMMTKVPE